MNGMNPQIGPLRTYQGSYSKHDQRCCSLLIPRWVTVPRKHASSYLPQTTGTRWRMALWWAVWPLNLGRCFVIDFGLGEWMVLFDWIWYSLGLDVWYWWTLASIAKMISVHQIDWRIYPTPLIFFQAKSRTTEVCRGPTISLVFVNSIRILWVSTPQCCLDHSLLISPRCWSPYLPGQMLTSQLLNRRIWWPHIIFNQAWISI